MSNSVSVDAYLHIEGFDNWQRDAFNKRKIRGGMRKAGKIVAAAAQLNIALARGAGNYPVSRTGRLVHAIRYKVSASGFMVHVAPYRTGDMKDYYPAYLHYGVKEGRRLGKLAPGEGRGKSNRRRRGQRAAELAARAANPYRIAPRANYMEDALQDRKMRVQEVLRRAFAEALG